ncbi:DUF6701 domain-containing protein [Reinekea sp.]|jgi:MSHA biogenesis protein MshQ|uniref:DUF6701 domain-containing protein n=1 Tax=Reinekea sp. TaxID=1970455 RepID=UPI002A801111|nr:DUF6701 domain-containing protein [Reinekea sp.]
MKGLKRVAALVLSLFPALSQAATYTLPADFGASPFGACSAGTASYSCSSSVTLPNNTVIEITEAITLTVSGSLVIRNNVQVNLANTDLLTLSATGNLTLGTNANIFAALSADANITVGSNANLSGDLTAAANIIVGNNASITGDLTAPANIQVGANAGITGDVTANTLSFGSNSSVVGNCSPDNVACTAPLGLPPPLIEYRFDENGWNGTEGEVVDSSGSTINATSDSRSGTTTSSDAVMCQAANFNGGNKFITSTDLSALRTTASLSFWIKTTQRGDSRARRSPGVTGIEQAGGRNDIFWGWLNAEGHIGITVGNRNSAHSNIPISDDSYHHIVLTRDALSNTYQIFIDGQVQGAGNYGSRNPSGTISNIFTDIGRVADTAGTPVYLDALIDELSVFDSVLTAGQAEAIFNLQSAGKNLDGSTRSCAPPPTPATCFSDDFNRTDLGPDWSATSRGGSFGMPRIIDGRLQLTDASNSNSTAATLLRLFPSAGNKVVTEFTLFAYGGGNGGADGVSLAFSDSLISPQPGGFGGSLGYAPSWSTSGFAGGWVGVGIDEYGNFLVDSEGRSGGFNRRVRDTITVRGSGSGTTGYNYITSNGIAPGSGLPPVGLSPTVQTDPAHGDDTGHRYRITIDQANDINAWISVERDDNLDGTFTTLIANFDLLAQSGQAAIPEKLFLTLTASTGGERNIHSVDDLKLCATTLESVEPQIDHYELDRDSTQGLTCEPLNIEIRACLNAACSVQADGTITTEFSPISGWAESNTQTYSSEDSLAFQLTSPSEVTLGVNSSTLDFNPMVPDERVRCYVGGERKADCKVQFVDTALRFFASGSGTKSISLDLVAALETPFDMRAISTNEATGECETQLFDYSPVNANIYTKCKNPTSCPSSQQVSWIQGSDTTNLANDVSTGAVDVQFNSDGTAEFKLKAPDVGLQELTVKIPLLDVNNNATGELIMGSVELRVRPHWIKVIDVKTITDPVESLILGDKNTVRAGEPFTVKLEGLDSQGNPVKGFSLIDRSSGEDSKIGLLDVTWIHDNPLTAPGSLTDTNIWQVEDHMLTAQLSYDEVSEISLTANIADFWGDGTNLEVFSDDNALLVGKFIPAYLTATQDGDATWGTADNAYQGRSDTITNADFRIRAYGVAELGTINNPLKNYDNTVPGFKVSDSQMLQKGSGFENIGGSLTSTSSLVKDAVEVDEFDYIPVTVKLTKVIWARSSSAPTISDINDQNSPSEISTFELSNSIFTDDEGNCVRAGPSQVCSTDSSTLKIASLPLYYVRLNIPETFGAPSKVALIPVTLEYLSKVPLISTTNLGDYEFLPMTTENSLNEEDFTELVRSLSNICTLQAKLGETAADAETLCNTVISSSTFDDPFASGTKKMLAGQGVFKATADRKVSGLVEAHPLLLTGWATWYWDGDTNADNKLDSEDVDSAASTLITFGEYQGRTPLLFVRPRFR